MDIESYVASLALPGIAPSLNGEYLEDVVPGFRTAEVEGRESLDSNITEIDLKTVDGSRFKNKVYTPKEITVYYYITCNNPEDLHKSGRELRAFLDQNRDFIRVIFNDDPNVYYEAMVKTISADKLVDGCSVSGSYVLRCLQPFAYSVEEFIVPSEVIDGKTVITANYNGTYPAQPILEASIPATTGYVGFINDARKIIQVGDPKEEDAEVVQNQQLLSKSFKNNSTSNFVANIRGCADTIAEGTTKSSREGLTANELGATQKKWHGPSLIHELSQTDIENCSASISYIVGLFKNEIKCNGGVSLSLVGHYANDQERQQFEVISISIWKRSAASDEGAIGIWIKGERVWLKTFKFGTLKEHGAGIAIHSDSE